MLFYNYYKKAVRIFKYHEAFKHPWDAFTKCKTVETA